MDKENKNNNNITAEMTEMPVTKQERKVIEILRGLDFGEERIIVKDHEVIRVEEKKSIRL